MLASRFILLIGLSLMAIGCGQSTTPSTAAKGVRPQTKAESEANAVAFAPHKLAAEHLPNPWQIHPKVISGGLPEGDAAFTELAALGVKTIISVDGAKPDVKLARQHGLRYVHLPHGYNGVPAGRKQELAKAVRDLPGPIYIHCHHGKHRSPAAAAVACVGSGLLDSSGAEVFLKVAGTSENYQGLYAAAREAQRIDTRLLDELQPAFVETAALAPLAEAMVALEHTHDHLQQVSAANWKSPPKHPDLDPAHEALLLREHFTELLRADSVKTQPAEFQALLRASEADAQQLEDSLRAWKAGDRSGPPPAEAAKSFERVSANCKTCHTAYRDVPLRK